MTSVSILSCFMPFLAYRDKKRANGPISLSLYPRNGIKQDRINTEVIICFISQKKPSKDINYMVANWKRVLVKNIDLLGCQYELFPPKNTNIKYLDKFTFLLITVIK